MVSLPFSPPGMLARDLALQQLMSATAKGPLLCSLPVGVCSSAAGRVSAIRGITLEWGVPGPLGVWALDEGTVGVPG